ncbi:type IV pilin protein [Bradymonas sediminis]|uniref:Uncharacterized protein n=1 Tax=Bradymonas sediminis TaxID=1548548 RepID=A0A2Z4FLR8_9DELT|nr:hypothetical protein [Bradymonas sediminis]AWV89913.1 hypothetical protein DN745_11410 [Bradymonas sediminis]TDP62015.1 hypothetical protein DFR33_11531 [Bradymonas sediminis]
MYCSKMSRAMLIAFFCLLGAPLGCASNAAQPDQPAATSQVQPLEPAADIFARYAAYMPEDTAAVAIVRTEKASSLMQQLFYSPDPEKGQKHLDAMRADFGELLLDNFGLDPLSADVGIVVLSPSVQFIILDGEIHSDFKSQKTVRSNGLTAHYVETTEEFAGAGVWVSRLPDTPGLAVFADSATFERVASTSEPLAKSAKGELLGDLLTNSPTSAIAGVVALQGPLGQALAGQLPFPLPDALSFQIDAQLRVELRGDAATIEAVGDFVEDFRQTNLTTITRAYQDRAQRSLPESTFITLSYHLTQHLNDNLVITGTATSLELESPLPLGLVGVTSIGAISSVAIPGFLRYIKNSKAAEAQSVLNTLQRRVTQYYEEHSADGTCTLPPAANPVPADVPCCDGVGPSNGEKWTAPAGTWEQEGWKAISFSLEDPTYFAYQMLRRTPPGGPELLTLLAFADFVPGGPRHTLSLTLISRKDDAGQCTLIAQPAVVVHEYE